MRCADDSSNLLCYRLNHRMIHLPAQNRAIRLQNNIVGTTIIHDRPLLAQWVELRTGKEITSFNDDKQRNMPQSDLQRASAAPHF